MLGHIASSRCRSAPRRSRSLRVVRLVRHPELIGPGISSGFGTVVGALADAAEYPQANPWYRAIYAGEAPVGFVMISWNCVPQPPEIIGPWFLWKLLIDHRYQGRGYGADAVRVVAELIGHTGATELLTSCFRELDGSPAPFYERLGFVPTGDLDVDGETIFRLDVQSSNDAAVDPRPEDGAQ